MIIDFHTHVFPDRIADKTVVSLGENCGIPSYSDGRASGLREKLKSARVCLGVNLPAITKPSQFESVLEFAYSLNEEYETEKDDEGAKILSFAGIHPECEDISGKMAKIKSMGFKGVKIHPDYQGQFIDSPGYVDIVRAAKAEDLIVVTHAGVDSAFRDQPIRCTPKRVLRLLDAVGGYEKLVLAHLGGNELYDEVMTHLAGQEVYFDTAYVLHELSEEQFKKLLRKHTADRILFATDSPWRDIGEELEILRSFNLEEDIQEKILSLNARKLLGI